MLKVQYSECVLCQGYVISTFGALNVTVKKLLMQGNWIEMFKAIKRGGDRDYKPTN